MAQFITIPNLTDYSVTLRLMEDHVNKIISANEQEIIYLVEHSEVYTAGTSYKQEELLNYNNVPIIYTGRGGKFTFHGPGQRVIYPILNLTLPNRTKDLKLYIKMLEEWIISTLNHFGVKSYIIEGKVGIWVKIKSGELAKIAAIGIRVRKWITYHGIAVNISTDLSKFAGIIPCGLENSSVTSLKQLGIHVEMLEFDKIIQAEFNKIFK